MAVTQILNALGTFEFELIGSVPRDIMDTIQYFGHVAIIPGRMDPRQYGDGCLTAARYVGVVRKKKMADDGRTNLVEDDIRIGGVGMEFWLGDDDGKGPVIENLTPFSTAGFATVMGATTATPIAGLRPPSVGAGTIYTVSGSYSGRHQYETSRSAIKYVCDTMSTAAVPVGYRVNNNATLDAGPESNLYVTNPVCAIVFKGVTQGEDMFLRALPSTADYDEDMEDFATRVVMLAESDSQDLATGSADISVVSPGTNVYKDMFGNTLAVTKLVSESDTTTPLADTRAELALRAVIDKNRSLTLSAEDYDFHGTFQPGDYVWVYDPDRNLYDTANEVVIRGVRINPIKLQVTEADWSICEGYTVAYRDANGNWTDLTDYVHWDEETPVKVVVGDFARTLSDTGQDVGIRLSTLTPADLLFPAAPTWNTPFAGASYNDSNGYPKASVLLSWNTPANTDGSTITDGQYYEVQLRLQGQTQWDIRFVTWGQNQLLLQDLAVGTGYEVRIRGVDTGGNAGAFSSPNSQFTTNTDLAPPAQPAAPSVATSTLAVQITHTLGKNTGGTYNMDQDLAYFEVHQGSTSGFVASGATSIGTVVANKGMMTATTPVVATFDVSSTVNQWYKVVGVDTSGNKSYANASPGASATATLVDTAHISDLTVSKVTAGTVSADWLLSSNIQTAASGARVALTSTGLKGYDSGGVNTVTITNDGTFSAVSSQSLADTPVIEYAGTSPIWNSSVSGSACLIYRPTGVQVGDLMLAFLETNSGTTATISMTGWTTVGTVTRGDNATANQDTNLIVLKRNYAIDDPQYWSGTTTTATRMQSVVVGYRGADTAGNQFLSNLSVSGASGAPATTKVAGPITNSTTGAWRVAAFAGLDTTSGGAWSIASSVGTDVERNDTEAGTASPFMTIAVYDSNGTVTNTAQSSTGTFANGYVSVVSWMGYLVPLPQASSGSRIEIDSQGIRTFNQVNTKTLDIVGGSGTIDLLGSVSSFNYLEGADGWKINSNGAAQFENLNVINTVGADNGNFDVSLQLGGVDVATQDFYQTRSPTVFVGKEAAQSVVITSAAGSTLITFDTKYHERNITENSMHNISSNPSRIKAPVDGIYHVSYNVTTYWNTSPLPTANTAHAIMIRKNSAGSFAGGSKITSCYGWISDANANYVTCPGSFDIALAAGDYLEWFSYTNASGLSSPTTRSTVGEVPACTYVSMRYVSSVDGIGVGGTTVGNATFFATACRTFQGNNTERPPNIADYAYQGQYDAGYGNQKSIILFDDAAIKTALTGKTITSCKLYYHVYHSYYSTMDVSVGTHNNSTETVWPGTSVSPNLKLFTNQAAGSSYTQELGATIGANFQTGGTAKGIVFGPGPSTVHNYYGYLAGWVPGNSNGFNPRLVFTYT